MEKIKHDNQMQDKWKMTPNKIGSVTSKVLIEITLVER